MLENGAWKVAGRRLKRFQKGFAMWDFARFSARLMDFVTRLAVKKSDC